MNTSSGSSSSIENGQGNFFSDIKIFLLFNEIFRGINKLIFGKFCYYRDPNKLDHRKKLKSKN